MHKRSGALTACLVAGAAALTAVPALAWTPPPQKQAVLLRLDDSPALPLLEPFRHAAGRPRSHLRSYLDGPFSRWRQRSWRVLRWCPEGVQPVVDAIQAGPAACFADSPLDPSSTLAISTASQAARLAGQPHGWPQRSADRHWFQPRAVDLVTPTVDLTSAPELAVSVDVMPPWLQRLDGDWTALMVGGFGCGRGGDCSTGAAFPATAFDKLWLAHSPKQWPIPTWQCNPREVAIQAHGREFARFRPMRCDGSIPPDALDRLSILARPPGVARPGDVLPDEPDPAATRGEWLPGVRVMHPRLLWVLQRIADEFPWKAIYIYSGYRPAPAPPPPGTRNSYHWHGRALDITLRGVDNEELFQLCRDLPDLGCGYYPNKPFVHIDVRPRGLGGVFWIDAAPTGEPARYVSSWPGVVDEGSIGWAPPP